MAEHSYLIVANGHWPDEEIWRPLVKSANHVVACDGAAYQCLENQVKMQTVIGDMDSLSTEIQTQIQSDSNVQFLRQEGQERIWVCDSGEPDEAGGSGLPICRFGSVSYTHLTLPTKA